MAEAILVRPLVWVSSSLSYSIDTTKSTNQANGFYKGAPPGMLPPGTVPPPGMQQANLQQPGRPGAFPANFQPPPNMPNINFSAPVIRLGTSGPAKPSAPESTGRPSETHRRSGLGAASVESQRQTIREAMMQLQPPTKEEILRTIFVGGITEGTGGDDGVERILRCAGNLKRWIRATDADDKPCKFGFAEYEDPESLSVALEVLKDVEVPVKRQMPREGDEEDQVDKAKLLVCFFLLSFFSFLVCQSYPLEYA